MRYTDEEIIALYQNGDPATFRWLHEQYFSRLVLFAMELIKSEPDAQEIASDALQNLFKGHSQYSFETLKGIKTYLYVATRHSCFNYLRNEKAKQERLVKYAYTLVHGQSETIESTEIDRGELLQALYKAVEALPEQARTAVFLLFEKGLTHGETARLMNVKAGVVKNYRARALRLLHKALKDNAISSILIMLVYFFLKK